MNLKTLIIVAFFTVGCSTSGDLTVKSASFLANAKTFDEYRRPNPHITPRFLTVNGVIVVYFEMDAMLINIAAEKQRSSTIDMEYCDNDKKWSSSRLYNLEIANDRAIFLGVFSLIDESPVYYTDRGYNLLVEREQICFRYFAPSKAPFEKIASKWVSYDFDDSLLNEAAEYFQNGGETLFRNVASPQR